MYETRGNKIVFAHYSGEETDAAVCSTAAAALVAVQTLNDAVRHQDKRRYTASARLIRRASEVDGFHWIGAFAVAS